MRAGPSRSLLSSLIVALLAATSVAPVAAAHGAPAEHDAEPNVLGTVRLPDGAPAVRASVTLSPLAARDPYGYGGGFGGYVTTNATGAFEARLAEGLYELEINLDETVLAPVSDLHWKCLRVDNSDCVVVRDGELTRLDLTLPPGAVVVGFVRSADSAPASRPIEFMRGARSVEYVYPDHQGRFVARLEAGAYGMRADAPYDSYGRDGASGSSYSLEYSLPCARIDRSDCVVAIAGQVVWWNVTLPQGGVVRGTLTDADGRPAQETVLQIGGEQAWVSMDGTFSLSLPPGRYAANASRGYSIVTPILPCERADGSDCVQVEAGKTTWRNLTLPASAAIVGAVVGPDGKPEEASIHASGTAGSYYGRTRADGTYRLDVAPGSYALAVTPSSYYAYRSNDRESLSEHRVGCGTEGDCIVVPDGQSVWHNVTLQRASSIRGFVWTTEGAPATSAYVSAVPRGRENDEYVYGVSVQDHVDEKGAFELRVAPGTYVLSASAYGAGGSLRGDCDATPPIACATVAPGGTTWMNLTFEPPARITGTVRDEAGAPISGADVRAIGWGASAYDTTDKAGEFSMDVEPGVYVLEISKTEEWQPDPCFLNATTGDPECPRREWRSPVDLYAPHRGSCSEPPTRTCVAATRGATSEVDVTLHDSSTLEGVVRDPQGAPLPGVDLYIHGATSAAWVTTGTDGRYRALIEPGAYSMFVTARWNGSDEASPVAPMELACADGTETTCVHVEGATQRDVTLRPAGILRGTIFGADGRPAEGTSLLAVREGYAVGFAYTMNGTFALAVGEGPFGLHIEPGWRGEGVALTVPCRADGTGCLAVPEGATAWRNFTLEEGYDVRGVVTDESGRPAAYATLGATADPTGRFSTDGDGSYSIRLPAGASDLVAAREGREGPSALAICGDAGARCVSGRSGDVVWRNLTLERTEVVRTQAVLGQVEGWALLKLPETGGLVVVFVADRAPFASDDDTKATLDDEPTPVLTTSLGVLWRSTGEIGDEEHVLELTSMASYGPSPSIERVRVTVTDRPAPAAPRATEVEPAPMPERIVVPEPAAEPPRPPSPAVTPEAPPQPEPEAQASPEVSPAPPTPSEPEPPANGTRKGLRESIPGLPLVAVLGAVALALLLRRR